MGNNRRKQDHDQVIRNRSEIRKESPRLKTHAEATKQDTSN